MGGWGVNAEKAAVAGSKIFDLYICAGNMCVVQTSSSYFFVQKYEQFSLEPKKKYRQSIDIEIFYIADYLKVEFFCFKMM